MVFLMEQREQLIDLQSEDESRKARRYMLQCTRRYRLFLLVITIPSLSRFRHVVWLFLMEYTREREQLIELQQSRVKANTNRDALREMICAIVHTQTLAFSYSLLRFLLSSFSSRRRVTTITFFFFSVRIYLRTTPLFLSVPNIALFRLSLIRSLR